MLALLQIQPKWELSLVLRVIQQSRTYQHATAAVFLLQKEALVGTVQFHRQFRHPKVSLRQIQMRSKLRKRLYHRREL